MLKLENLSCGYGSVEAVNDVSFDVPAGSIFALLGPNGAGKTSTIMAIMGHVDIHGGRILLEDKDITRRAWTYAGGGAPDRGFGAIRRAQAR